VDEAFILELVRAERSLQPRIGSRKLVKILQPQFAEAGVKIGRDRFFELLRRYDLLVEPVAATWPRTTNSRHCLPIFTNRLNPSFAIRIKNRLFLSPLRQMKMTPKITLQGEILERVHFSCAS
jgi:hypothetical protein